MDPVELGEFGLISRFRSRLKYRSAKLKIGIGDDCAVFKSDPGKYQIVSTDALLEKVHFDLATSSPEQLGRKALSVNISDIAAMGGTPTLALIALGIPPKTSVEFLDRFYDGLDQISEKYRLELAGGDTVASPKHLFINVTILGEADKDRLFTRAGARPGDKILVTGTLGDSALGLKLLQHPKKKWMGTAQAKKTLIQKHLDPTPRMIESQLLIRSDAEITSMIDISDGLAQDLGHICEAGSVGALLAEEKIPRSRALKQICSRNKLNSLDFALNGGEDYELLFTINPKDATKIEKRFQKANAPVAIIGEIAPEPGKLFLVKQYGRREPLRNPRGYDHFARTGR